MPKAPILERTGFLLTNKYDKSIRMGQWNVVETSLGTCVEPRVLNLASVDQKMNDLDVYDMAYTRIVTMDGDQFFAQYGTGGVQVTEDFSPQGF